MITRTRRTLVALVAAAALTMGLASCAGGTSPEQAAMQQYVEAERSQIPEILESSGGVYKGMTVESSDPNSIAFEYTYANQLDAAAVAAELDKSSAEFQAVCNEQMMPGIRAHGIKGDVNVSFIYLNLDGSEIWRKDMTCS